MGIEVTKSQRKQWVDIVKGIAIIMVVWQHSCQRTMTYFSLQEDPILKAMNLFVATVNMELFFAISGYIYFLCRDKYLANIKSFVKTRFYDLMIPYLILGPAIWLGKFTLSAFVKNPMHLSDLYNMFYVPIAFMWFIYVLFFVEVIVAILDKISKCNFAIVLLLLAVPLTIVGISNDVVNLTSRFAFWYYAGGLFYLGRKYLPLTIVIKRWALVVIFLLWVSSFGLDFIGFCTQIKQLQKAFAVLFFMLLCYDWTNDNKLKNILNYIGVCSMYIYILNPLIINGLRQVMVRIGIDNLYVSFAVFFIVTIAIACGIREIAKRFPPLEFIFSPRKYLIKNK